MEKNKPLDKKEINNEKQNLKKEIERLDIYKNCNNYDRDQLVCYFPNRETKIGECFCKEEGKKVLQPNKKEQLQNIIMDELCSLLYPCIEKGYKVKQLNGDLYHSSNQKYLICLNTPKNDKNIGILISQECKIVFTNGKWRNDTDIDTGKDYTYKLRLLPVSGIKYYNQYMFPNQPMIIYNESMNYTLSIYPDAKTIKLTDFGEFTTYTTFCDENEIFKDKEDIVHFFLTLSFTETEQVLQILNERLKSIADKKLSYKKFDIKTVLKGIKDTIKKKNRQQKQENGEEIDNKNKNKNSDTKPQLEMEEEYKTSCNDCITCLKQCWPSSEKGK